MHGEIMLESNYEISWLILKHHKADFDKGNFELGVRNPCNVYAWFWVSRA